MFNLYLEVDTGEILQIIRPDGDFAAKSLQNFFNIYSDYESIYEKEAEEHIWFKRFEDLSRINLRILWNITYAGDWNFGVDEYERFKRCTDYNPFKNKEDFIKEINSINNLCMPIDEVIKVIEEIIRVLPEMKDGNYWFNNHHTQLDFQGLLNTLILSKKRYGKEVRLKDE